MRTTELLRLVLLNINQNKFKAVMTSIGIVVGAATIVFVMGIGRGGQLEVAEQFAELNAGAIDVSYEYAGEEESSGNYKRGFPGGFSDSFSGDGRPQLSEGDSAAGAGGGIFPGGERMGSQDDASSGSAGANGLPGSGGPEVSGGISSGGEGTDDFPDGDMPGIADGDLADHASSGLADDTDRPARRSGSASGRGEIAEGQEAGPGMAGADRAEAGAAKADGAGAAADSAGADGAGAAADSAGAENAGTGSTGAEDAEAGSAGAEDAGAGMDAAALNQEQIILAQSDVEDIAKYVQGISGVTISYSARASVEGADLTSAQTYPVAGVKESYESVSKLAMAEGSFITAEDDETKSRVCVLGATVAEELFGSDGEIVGSTLYLADRSYTVSGVLEHTAAVSAGISPDTSILIPYETGIKYVTGEEISPVITVLAADVNSLDSVIGSVKTVLEENYDHAEFTFEDAGSRMQAAMASNQTLTLLLSAMAAIVFLVGGIGIMNVLFVSVRERTNEIGILKAVGTSRGDILAEFLLESAAISCIGGVLGVGISLAAVPAVEWLGIRVEVTVFACAAALGFAVLTGTIFGIYPAWKASRLRPVEALNAE